MREILFRGKRMNNGEWVESGSISRVSDDGVNWDYYFGAGAPATYVLDEHGNMLAAFTKAECVFYRVDPNTIGQYTGLTDKNGNKIFEGDICRFREWSEGEMCWIGKVHWGHQQFMISGGRNKECETMFELCMSRFIPENIEVIGNIHDNPELLEDGDTERALQRCAKTVPRGTLPAGAPVNGTRRNAKPSTKRRRLSKSRSVRNTWQKRCFSGMRSIGRKRK